jgi:hypothetical protein
MPICKILEDDHNPLPHDGSHRATMIKLKSKKIKIKNRALLHQNYLLKNSEKYKHLRSKGGATKRAKSSQGEALSPP